MAGWLASCYKRPKSSPSKSLRQLAPCVVPIDDLMWRTRFANGPLLKMSLGVFLTLRPSIIPSVVVLLGLMLSDGVGALNATSGGLTGVVLDPSGAVVV